MLVLFLVELVSAGRQKLICKPLKGKHRVEYFLYSCETPDEPVERFTAKIWPLEDQARRGAPGVKFLLDCRTGLGTATIALPHWHKHPFKLNLIGDFIDPSEYCYY
jgi:hypothetical protein